MEHSKEERNPELEQSVNDVVELNDFPWQH